MIKSVHTTISGGSFQRFAQALPRCLGAIVLSSALFCGSMSAPAAARRTAAHGKSVRGASAVVIPRRVLALYYPWYGTPSFGGKWLHQDGVNTESRTMTSHTHYPLSGPYDSTDPAVIDRHLRQAKSAGIDTLVCSWWGLQDRSDKGIRMLLKRAPKFAMTVCVFWEPYHSAFTQQDAQADLTYILQAFGKQRGYLRYGGKPVVFLYSKTSQGLAPDQWVGALNAVSGRERNGVLAIAENETQAGASVWDSSYTLWPITRRDALYPDQSAQSLHRTFQDQISGSNSFHHPTVETIGPGYDDQKFNRSAGQNVAVLVGRQNGQRYRSLWEQTLKDAPDWVLINSFNEWHNGTEIEPSSEMGDQYLQMTGTYARRFKSGDAVPIHRSLRR